MDALSILTIVLDLIQKAETAAPIVIRGVENATPFAVDLWKRITGQEPNPVDMAALDKALADMSKGLAEPLPPAQPGDPDYVP